MIRYILQRRWLAWHLLWLAAVALCVWLGIWQFRAATAPHPPGADTQVWRNYAYALNWVVFALVAVWFWWRFMRDQRASERGTEQPPAPSPPAAPAGQRFDPFAEPDPPSASGLGAG